MDEKMTKKDEKKTGQEPEIRELSCDDLDAVAGGRGGDGGRHKPPT